MRSLKFLKHNVSAKEQPNLTTLLDNEGVKGYGVYWILMEYLGHQAQLKAPLSVIKFLKKQYRINADLMDRVMQNYDLFVVEKEHFHSPDLLRQVRHKSASPDAPKNQNEEKPDNQPSEKKDASDQAGVEILSDQQKKQPGTEGENKPETQQELQQTDAGLIQNRSRTGSKPDKNRKKSPHDYQQLSCS